jgi:alpha-D-ribose 1-methylphosphonate 5-triphosphate synthase subunit PhnG
MGGIGDRFFAGDATLTRAAVRLADASGVIRVSIKL